MKSLSPSSQSQLEKAANFVPLPPHFYLSNTTEVARALLGKGLFISAPQKSPLLVEIVEVEAYLGSEDPASHAYRGMTKRNWPMFELGGMCYVYLSYGINFCMNVVTREKGVGEAVLIRAAAPILGLESIRHRALSGPGKLTHALGIDLSYNGLTFDRRDFKLIDLGKNYSEKFIGESPRIGISRATVERLRFFIRSSPWLSRKG